MRLFTVALLQLSSAGFDQEANLKTGEAACRHAASLGADLALFPEMWNIGYTPFDTRRGGRRSWRAPTRWQPGDESRQPAEPGERERWQARAIPTDGPFVEHFRRLARTLDMAIAVTYLERWHPAPRNVVSLIDRHGELAFTYAKVHTCDFDEPELSTSPGDRFHVAALDTRAGDVHLGAMICYDREFPESARILMLGGAEIVLTPNACHLDAHRIGQFQTRANENMIGVAMANYAAPEQNGHSCAFDPVTYGVDGRPRDNLVVEAGDREGVYPAVFDLDALRAWREEHAWGASFRKPHRYVALVAPDVAAPVVRTNSGGERYDAVARQR